MASSPQAFLLSSITEKSYQPPRKNTKKLFPLNSPKSPPSPLFISLILDKPYSIGEHPHLNQALRQTLISVANDASVSTRSCLSGHTPEGHILQRPHVMIVPLIQRTPPAGSLLSQGLQLIIPAEEPEIVRLEIELIVRRLDKLYFKGRAAYRIKCIQTHKTTPRRNNILLNTSYLWTTMTPLMLDRFPKEKHPVARQQEIARLIAASCRRLKLPEPIECTITYHGLLNGVPPFHGFPKPDLQHGRQRPLLHTTLIFKQAVRGPIALGAARYKGYGIFAPLEIKNSPDRR